MAGRAEEASHPAILFANPRSGRGKRWLFDVSDRCPEHGIDLRSVHFNLEPAAIRAAIGTAREGGITSILACGGDGTMGSVSACLHDTDLVMGVLPAGTSNDFARSLRIPMDVDGALRVIADRAWTRVDLGSAGGEVFCHVAAVGINTEFARAANSTRTFLGRISYPVAAARVFLNRRRYSVRVNADGRTETLQAYEVAVVNAPAYGGRLGLEVSVVDLKDRKLGIVVVGDIQMGAVARAALRVLQGRPFRIRGLQMFSAREASIETSECLQVTLDGEINGETPCIVRVLPNALRVYAPREFITGGDA